MRWNNVEICIALIRRVHISWCENSPAEPTQKSNLRQVDVTYNHIVKPQLVDKKLSHMLTSVSFAGIFKFP